METDQAPEAAVEASSEEEAPLTAPVLETESPDPQGVPEVEGSSEGQVEPDKPNDRELELAEKFNQVTERERVLRDSEDTNRSAAEELKTAQDILAKFKDNPLEGLKALGIDFKDVANIVLNDDQPTAEMQVSKLRADIEARDKAAEEKEEKEIQAKEAAEQKYQNEEQERAVIYAKDQIQQLIDGNPEKYELIKTQNAQDIVWDVAAGIFQKTKVLPEWDKVCEQVEEQLTKEVEKYFETNKFKAKYQQIPKVMNHDDERDLEANYYSRQMIEEKHGRSLSNHMASEGSSAPTSNDYRTDEESKEYLAAKLTRMLEA